MRVAYLEYSEGHWIDVARRLREESGWEPIWWTGESRVAASVRHAFGPNVFQIRTDAMRLHWPFGNVSDTASCPPSAEQLASLATFQVHALKMMGRMDADGRHFSCDERMDYYFRLVAWGNAILDSANPDLVCFIESPHVVYDYVIYALCQTKGIRTLMHIRTKVDEHVLISPRFERGPEWIQQCVGQAQGELPEHLQISRRRLGRDYKTGMPLAARAQTAAANDRQEWLTAQLPLWNARWKLGWESLRQRLAGPRPVTSSYLKSLHSSTLESPMSRLEYRRAAKQGLLKRRRLKRLYTKLSSRAVDDERYVYLPLNYQPEKTSSPDGGWYADLLLMVRSVSTALPKGYQLYVREHPATFLNSITGAGRGHMLRTEAFYDALANQPNVRLISLGDDPFALIDRSHGVVTLTGTAGWEAVNRGKPVLCFGAAWYIGCPGVEAIWNFANVKEAVWKLLSETHVNSKDVDRYWEAVHRNGKRAFINRKRCAEDVDSDANVTALTRLWQEGYTRFYDGNANTTAHAL